MAKLARYDPFSLARTDPFGGINNLFKGLFMRPVLSRGKPQMQIKMDKVARSFTLAHDVDEANAQAKYSDGVLELTLPNRAGATARKLAIH